MTGPGMVTMRRMTDNDEARVAQVLARCFQWLGEREGWTAEQVAWMVSTRGRVKAVVDGRTNRQAVVATEGGEILGVLVTSGGEIKALYVDPVHHRHGVGRRLFERAEALLREDGHRRVTLGCAPTAAPFYEAMGMTVACEDALTEGPFANTPVVIMEKHLQQGGIIG